MTPEEMQALMYPVGKYQAPDIITQDHITSWTNTIRNTPYELLEIMAPMEKKAFQYQYRPQGWTLTQVVHHMSDSHLQAFTRFKLALTETLPTIKPYDENAFVHLADTREEHIHLAYTLIQAAHAKWVVLLEHMSLDDFHQRKYFHPESQKEFTLGVALGLYDWHCRHHLQHIRNAIASMGRYNGE